MKPFQKILLFSALLFPQLVHAATEAANNSGYDVPKTFLWIAIILIAAKASSLVERFGQPSVLGELAIGVVLGNLSLLGFSFFESIKSNQILMFLSQLGVVVLLFQIGLESNVNTMKRVGFRAFLVATVGVIAPFVLGYFLSPFLLPGQSNNTYIFLGAALTATSVGITARVFKDLGKLQTKESQIVLGAAVIDDVMGLIILSVVSAIITSGSASIGQIALITFRALLFLTGAVFLGQILALHLGKLFSKIHAGNGMKFCLAMIFCLSFAYFASLIDLAPIVGAFAAGLVLDPVDFKFFMDPQIVIDIREAIKDSDTTTKEHVHKALQLHTDHHIEDLIEPIGLFLVPIFFVITGINVKLETLFDLRILGIAVAITLIAAVGKIIAGTVAGKCNKLIVGFGMIPRGEVGLIFAVMGKSLGVINDEIFSIIVIVVMLTTLLTPPVLTAIIRIGDKNA